MNFEIIEFNLLSKTITKIPAIEMLKIYDENSEKIYWIHCDLSDREMLAQLITKLNLKDAVKTLFEEKDTLPKFLDNDDELTIQIPILLSTEIDKTQEIQTENIFIHLTHQYCLTVGRGTSPALIDFKENYHKSVRYAKTPCFILFLLLDNIMNDYAKVLYNIEAFIDSFELSIREKKDEDPYADVMQIKQQVMKIKRFSMAIREILVRISGRKISVISEQCRSSLYNLSNHTQIIVNEVDSIREILNGLLGQIDNLLMQKMNNTMRVLTAFAAIFLPLTLITGIYGMNFHWIPELSWRYGYFFSLGLLLVCGVVLLIFFKYKKWF